MVRIQYHDVGARIGAHVAGKRKKCVKKVQNFTKSALFGGIFCISSILDTADTRQNVECNSTPTDFAKIIWLLKCAFTLSVF